MSAQVTTEIEELLEKFQRLTPEEQIQFLEQAQQIVQRDEEATAQARAFLESRGLPVPENPVAIRRKVSLLKFLEEIRDIPREPIDESRLSEHDRVLYGKRFGDDE